MSTFSNKPITHIKAMGVDPADKEAPQKFPVGSDVVSWDTSLPNYKPTEHTTKNILEGPIYADPIDAMEKADVFNSKEYTKNGIIDRRSYHGLYKIDNDTGRPINPVGRTGMTGRGRLGRWGPNKAADPIVTRWKKDTSGKKILQCVLIKRKDNGEWAIPGGMVETGDTITNTLRKEFAEEAMNMLELTDEEKAVLDEKIKKCFENGIEVYKGYVDDPRNTDNSWMETVAVNFHDEDGTGISQFELNAGDDAVGVMWIDLHPDMKLYASHSNFIQRVMAIHGILE